MDDKKSVILGLIIVILVCILTTGCSIPKAINSEEFKEHFAALGYTVSDSEEALYESDKYLVASKSDVPYKILFYEFKDETEAKKVYKKYKDTISDYITSNSQNQETTGAIISRIVAVSEKEYLIISRVKKTLIFIAGTNDYKNDIDSLLKDIGY